MSRDILSHKDYNRVISVGENGVIDDAACPDDLRSYSERLTHDRRIKKVLIPKECLTKRISALAGEIANDAPPNQVLHIMIVLTGAMFFAVDLGRELYARAGIDVQFHLIKTSVYGDSIKKSEEHRREVKLKLEPKGIADKDILVVEDITDQGLTLSWLKNYLLLQRKVSSVRICCLLDKELENPAVEIRKLREQLRLDYTGFKIPDVWVAGYGVDVAQELRNLPCIVAINEALYHKNSDVGTSLVFTGHR